MGEWKGPEHGMPAVGTLCEFYVPYPDCWFHPELKNGARVEIIAHYTTFAGYPACAFKFDNAVGHTYVDGAAAECFRPLDNGVAGI